MHEVELVLISLLLAVAVFATAARVIGIPYPIVLVVGGLLLGAVPGLPRVELEPDLVLVIFLPPLLYAAAFFANLRDLRENLRVISLLAIVLVLFTMAVVAVFAHEVIHGFSLAAAFTHRAFVPPANPTSAPTNARRRGRPARDESPP